MQIDIGFGDVIYPSPVMTELPVMLPFPSASLLCYSRESSIAEKFQAMVKLGEINSRMKDFFDIWKLSRQFDFSGDAMSEAMRLTFKYRKTEVPPTITAFSSGFIEMKQIQWAVFHRRIKQPDVPLSFLKIVIGSLSKILKFILVNNFHKLFPEFFADMRLSAIMEK